ncbi:MAG: hypothetical protein NTZ57_09855 [Deltaproteobacteria bacterium]|nr:hypothetical protein [Deltaproteobacteria bacterium]
MTPDEAQYEEYMDELYEEHKEQAIQEFIDERLQSYYGEHRVLAKAAFGALTEAKNLICTNATAAFLFSAIAMEVGLRETLVKPIVFGLVHTLSVASLITDMVLSRPDHKKYRNLLLQILRQHGGVDIYTYKRLDSHRPIWEEITDVKKKRDLIMHQAETVTIDEAGLALGVASTILENMFPTVVAKMGLHLHEGFRICDNWKCTYKGTPIETILKAT